MIKKVFLFFLLLLSFISFSQQQWSLQQCVDYALKNNLQLKQQEINVKLSQVNSTNSKAQVLPSINGSASHNYNWGRNINPVDNTLTKNKVLSQNFSLTGNLNLFNGLQTYNTIKQREYDVQGSKYDLDDMKNDLTLNIVSAYLQVLFAMEAFDNAKNQQQLTVKQVERMEKMLDVGAVAKSSVLDMQAQLANDDFTITNAQNTIDISYLNLAQLMNYDSLSVFTIAKPVLNDPNQTEVLIKQEQIFQTALTWQPAIKGAEFKLKSTERALRIARGGVSPSLSLFASISSIFSDAFKTPSNPQFLGYFPTGAITGIGDVVYEPSYTFDLQQTPFKDQMRNNLNKSVGVRLSVPIFNNLLNKSNIDRAQLNSLSAKYNLEDIRNQLEKEIQQAHANASAAQKKYQAGKQAVQAFEESFKYAEQKFNVGSISSYDYNDSKNRLTKSQSDLLQAKYDYILKLKVLDFYMGKPLVL